jgi:hypothetical protein
MAAVDYNGVVQQLYVSYFGRPADYFGLQNFTAQLNAIGAPTTFAALNAQVQADEAGTSALSRLVNSFSASGEATNLYGTDTTQLGVSKFVAAIYQNVLGREADAEGFAFWVNAITSGTVTRASAAADITAGALVNTSAQGMLDKMTVEKKLAVATNFTTALDLPSEFNAYAGDAAAASARGLLQGVTSTTDVAAYQSNVNTTIGTIVAGGSPGQNFTLTSSIDNLMGTAGNDNFVATINAAGNPLGSLDVIDGGAGRDTLSIADGGATALSSLNGLTLRSIENLNVSSVNAFNGMDISATGVTTAFLASTAAAANSTVTAASTTDVTLTTTGTSNATVNGGKAVTINGAGTNTVNGSALTGVTIKGGSAAVNNSSAVATPVAGEGTTLTSVTLDTVTGGSIAGRGVTTVNLANISTAAAISIANSGTATAKPLTVNLNAVDGAVVTANNATTVAINASTTSRVTLGASAATAATVSGAGDLSLTMAGGTSVMTSLDASAATGSLTLAGVAAGVVSLKGSAGVDTFTTTQTAKVTFDLGAGNDALTVGTVIAAGSTINLGAGNDRLIKGAAGSFAASTTTATTIVDGGDGIDTLAAGFLNAGNASQFRNFEVLGLDASTLDVALAGSSFTGLELLAGGGVYTNATIAQGLTVNTNVTGNTSLSFSNAAGAADAYTVTFGSTSTGTTAAPTAISAGTVTLNGIESINVVSNAASGVAANAIVLADAATQNVTVTGNQALNLAFAAGFGNTATKGVTSINGSGATGALTISTANVTAASTGLTVTGGSGADVITLTAAASAVGGAGNDTFNVGGATDFMTTLTGGAGNDTFNVATATGTASMTTITDFVAANDKIVFSTGGTFAPTKVDVSSAQTFETALNLAAAGTTGTAITWFTYGTDTYIVDDNTAGTTFGADDIVVKLVGTFDLSTAASSIVSAAAPAPTV